jgi:long chain fatty acid CoA FadD26
MHGVPGDRALIIAPQGLAYIVGFLGAMQAGFIAVPLSVPLPGSHDERVSAVITDTSPTVVLTTAAAFDIAAQNVDDGASMVAVIAVDTLGLDADRDFDEDVPAGPDIAYLQYTSGSTRLPAGVMISHRNLRVNVEQLLADLLSQQGGQLPPGSTLVSWLPFYHDMGLVKGVCAPLICGRPAVLMSPLAFLQRPARWVQLLAKHPGGLSAAPNFAFELAARRTTDEDMAGLDLRNVEAILSGAERVHAATLKRFTDRFAGFGLDESVIRPSYGLAEATVYAACSNRGTAPSVVRFDYEKLSSGHARRCAEEIGSTELIGHGTTRSTALRIVDPETSTENPAGQVGEIWLHGKNVAKGYWKRRQESQRVFGGRLVNASPGTPEGPWLRTGDLGVISEGELFIIGRIKDLLIVDGSNHYPDDIEATIQEISKGRCAAISVETDQTERLVTIVEVKRRSDSSEEEHRERLRLLKRDIVSAVSNIHRLRIADLVFVGPGALPITTSGKVRRSSCAEYYRLNQFDRMDTKP